MKSQLVNKLGFEIYNPTFRETEVALRPYLVYLDPSKSKEFGGHLFNVYPDLIMVNHNMEVGDKVILVKLATTSSEQYQAVKNHVTSNYQLQVNPDTKLVQLQILDDDLKSKSIELSKSLFPELDLDITPELNINLCYLKGLHTDEILKIIKDTIKGDLRFDRLLLKYNNEKIQSLIW